MEDDAEPDLDEVAQQDGVGFKVYRRRWFVLFVLCLLNCSNALLWLTFAPVADQTARYLGVSLDQVNWLSLVYMVVAIPLGFVTTWMLDTWGLRVSLILGSWLNMVGSFLRYVGTLKCLPPAVWGFPLLMCGQTLCAAAQPLVIFSPTKLAALWFPEHQRATANMIASMSNPLGLLFANIFSPLITGSAGNLPLLLGIYVIPASIVCLLATLGIRGSVPPSPPSASAETSNSEPFLQGIKLLLRNKQYMVLLLFFGTGIGVFTCFSSLLEQILCVRGYTNDFSGLCGALFIVFGIVGAAFLGLYVDRTKKFMEAAKINMSLSALACAALAVVSQMRDQKATVAAICSLFGFFGFSVFPVVMELSVECSYPVGEASSAGLIFISGQVQSILYIVVLQALTQKLADSPFSVCALGEDAALSWRVPVLVMAGLFCMASCFFVIVFHTNYRRLRAEEVAAQKAGEEEDSPGNAQGAMVENED
ncbi:solute carrier family 49 member A3 isoform X1 [Paramormyrops kingsleyae]|uniref:Solute carrier family 49 member 3 n=1 Tax=Paramormyrops kingsleyae TaxID=1676925 RepID=A0A3B3T570_9TELE|nr:solute carrier family 49 member A3 isoform X1 [Paramormyrops kingsleyae]